MDKIKILQMYTTVVDSGNFAKAASELGLSPSTISKAISRLEYDLGFKLFNRNTRQLKLTNAGAKYAETAKELLTKLKNCEALLKEENEQPTGTLRLNVPVSYGRLYVLPMLSRFKEEFPNISVNITFSDEHVDLIGSNIDLCIRSGKIDDCRFIAKKLSPIDFVTCASPDYINKRGIPESIADFEEHTWIGYRFKQTGKLFPIIFQNDFMHGFKPKNHFVVDDGEAMMDLCINGQGIVQAPHFLARKSLIEGKVKTLFPSQQIEGHSVYALYSCNDRNYIPSKSRAFVNFLQKNLGDLGESSALTWANSLLPLNKVSTCAPAYSI